MKSWESALVSPHTTLRDALEKINQLGSQVVLVVDAERKLLGTLTDGDARRGLLKGLALSDPVEGAMHRNPKWVSDKSPSKKIIEVMKDTGLHQLPVLNDSGVVVGLSLINDFLQFQRRDNWIVIMAGGLGSRLKELTENIPKPMLRVGDRPVLETIIRSYIDQGFYRFFLAVNYKAEQIEEYFGDGSKLGVDIRYIRENKRMGTAGALSLLPEEPSTPFFVTNADLLLKMNYCEMIDRHISSGALGTMAVRSHEIQIPFGVVSTRENGTIDVIKEKPVQEFLVNAGVYVLSPETLELIPKQEFFDMPTLFDVISQNHFEARVHLIDGYWLDIGRIADLRRANEDFHNVFNS